MRNSKVANAWSAAGTLASAALCAALIANLASVSSAKGKPGQGDGGTTPSEVPIAAFFMDQVEGGNARITMSGALPITDGEESLTNGHSHLAQTGNYTLQLGGGKGKRTDTSDRTLTFNFGDVVFLDPSGEAPAGDELALNEMFLAINRKYCHEDDDTDPNTCPAADQWFNSASDGSQPGLRDMTRDEAVPVSISMRPRSGPDYQMYCTESSNDTLHESASDVTEFAIATCVSESNGACQHWAIRGTERNGDDAAMSCGLWLDGSRMGVFDMDFQLQLCLEGVNDSDCQGNWPLPLPL